MTVLDTDITEWKVGDRIKQTFVNTKVWPFRLVNFVLLFYSLKDGLDQIQTSSHLCLFNFNNLRRVQNNSKFFGMFISFLVFIPINIYHQEVLALFKLFKSSFLVWLDYKTAFKVFTVTIIVGLAFAVDQHEVVLLGFVIHAVCTIDMRHSHCEQLILEVDSFLKFKFVAYGWGSKFILPGIILTNIMLELMVELEPFEADLLGHIFVVCITDGCWSEPCKIIVKFNEEDILFFVFIESKLLL